MFKPKIFGKYLIIDKIATGGLGEIYKAKSFGADGYEKLIAIKTVRPIYADEKDIVELFKSEAILSGSLDHPNVIKVFDHGKIKDKHFIAMEYIHGSDLRIIMRETNEEGPKIPEEVSIYIISEVCGALDYIHHKNDPRNTSLSIVHRDISPANILVSYDGKIKLIDFGVAKSTMQKEEEGVFVGKLRYASPEQVEYREVDFYSDIFSMGIVLYELLTYKNPFVYDKDEDTLTAIKEVHFKPLRDYIPHAKDSIDTIIKQALARNKEERFSRANVFAQALSDYIMSEGIQNVKDRFLEFFKTFFELREEKNKQSSGVEKQEEAVEGTIVRDRKTQKELEEKPDDGGTKIIKKGYKEIAQTKKAFVFYVAFTTITDHDGKELAQEHFQSITNELLKKIMDTIYRYGGSITELSSRSIGVVFGIPHIRDDDALRTMITAFSILNELQSFEEELHMSIDLKITIDQGVVVVDRTVKDISSFTISGDPVERAKTLLEYSRDHVITATQSIENYKDAGFQFKEKGSFLFRGKSEKYYEALERRKKQRITTKRIEYKTAFIGRKNELLDFSKFFKEVQNSHLGKAFALQGTLGLGKSRFVREFMMLQKHEKSYYVSAKPELEQTFKKNSLYSVIAELLKQIVGIKDSDSDGLIRTKLLHLKKYSLKDHDIHLLGSILGVEFPGSDTQYLEGEERKKELLRVIKDFFIRLSEKDTVLYIIDDSEWIDPASLEALASILKDVTKINLFLIYIMRNAEGKKPLLPNLKEYTFPALSKSEAEKMFITLIPKLDTAAKLKKELLLRADGNPLFIEEISKKLIGIKDLSQKDILSTLTLPKTLEDIFTTRIEGLEATDKRLLSVAACIGKNFRYDILEKMISKDENLRAELAFNLDESLATLLAEDLLRLDPEKSEPEYLFKHMMLYESMSKLTSDDDKKNYNRLVGEAIEDLFYDRIDDYYNALVHHFHKAECFEKEIHYLELVGDRQTKNYANEDAIKSYEQILKTLEIYAGTLKLRESVRLRKEGVIYQKIASIYQLIGKWEEGIKYAHKAIEKAESINDTELHTLSIKTLGRFYKIKGELDLALQYFTDATQIATQAGLKLLQAELTREIGSLYNFKGAFDTALTYIEAGLKEAMSLSDDFLIGRFENDRGIILTKKRNLAEALKSLERSVAYKEKINDKYGMGVTLGNIVEIYYTEENYARAREFCEKSISITQQISDRWGESVNYYNLGNIFFMQESLDEAKKAFIMSKKISDDISWKIGMLYNDIFLTYFDYHTRGRKKGIKMLEGFLVEAQKLDAQEGVLKAQFFLALLYHEENSKKYKKKIETLVADAKMLAERLNAKDVLKKIEENFK